MMNIIILSQQYEADDIISTVKISKDENINIRIILNKTARRDYNIKNVDCENHLIIDHFLKKIKHIVMLNFILKRFEEFSKKRFKSLHIVFKKHKILNTKNNALHTHTFNVVNLLIVEIIDQNVFSDVKRLKLLIFDIQSYLNYKISITSQIRNTHERTTE